MSPSSTLTLRKMPLCYRRRSRAPTCRVALVFYDRRLDKWEPGAHTGQRVQDTGSPGIATAYRVHRRGTAAVAALDDYAPLPRALRSVLLGESGRGLGQELPAQPDGD